MSKSPLIDKLLEVASGEVGHLDDWNMDNSYGKWYGLNNNPYSAMFVSWCFARIGRSDLVEITTPKGFASCSVGYEHYRDKKQIVWPLRIKRGDIVFMKNGGERINHCGIVEGFLWERVLGIPLPVGVRTIEACVTGEFNAKSGVHRRTRLFSQITGAARVISKNATESEETAAL